MITPEQAEKRIADLSVDQVRELTARRILGEDTAPVGSRHLDEPSEDVVIQLLRNDGLPEETRRAVIAGCETVYSKLLAWLAAPDHSDGGDNLAEAATRLCRVVDVAEPNELRGHADAMLNLALSVTVLPSGVLAAVVRAGMAFGCTPGHVPVWEQVLEREEVAAYAFNALLEIDPRADRVPQALTFLWQKQLCKKWNVDTAFLARKAARSSGSEGVIRRALFGLYREFAALPHGQDFQTELLDSLARRSWSQGWKDYVPEAHNDTSREVQKLTASLRSTIKDIATMSQLPARVAKDLSTVNRSLAKDIEAVVRQQSLAAQTLRTVSQLNADAAKYSSLGSSLVKRTAYASIANTVQAIQALAGMSQFAAYAEKCSSHVKSVRAGSSGHNRPEGYQLLFSPGPPTPHTRELPEGTMPSTVKPLARLSAAEYFAGQDPAKKHTRRWQRSERNQSRKGQRSADASTGPGSMHILPSHARYDFCRKASKYGIREQRSCVKQ